MRGAPVALRGALALGAVAAVVVLAACGGGGRARASDVPRISFRCQPVDFDCASKYLTRVVDDNGPDVALRTIATLQRDGEIAQQVDDHELAHAVGPRDGRALRRQPRGSFHSAARTSSTTAARTASSSRRSGQTATPRGGGRRHLRVARRLTRSARRIGSPAITASATAS